MVNWTEPSRTNKMTVGRVFPYQVGFTSPPCYFDPALVDFLKVSPDTIGVQARMLHVPNYAFGLEQRLDNFGLLEEVVACMAASGADVVGQLGTNWSHAGNRTPDEISRFCNRVSETYETPFHMAGYCLIEALQALNVERIAINAVYSWPDWRDGIARFLASAGFDIVYAGNFVDQGFYSDIAECNKQIWTFPYELAEKSMRYVAEKARNAEVIVVSGAPSFRCANGMLQRIIGLMPELEASIGKTIIASDLALYWRVYQTLKLRPIKELGHLMSMLR